MTTARRTEEWHGKHADEAIPQRVKARVFLRDGGRCQSCTRRVGPGGEPYAFDHITALINGGAHAEHNLQLLCRECHASKTKADVAEKSWVYRKRAKHIGIKQKRHGPLSKEYRRAVLARIAERQREELT